MKQTGWRAARTVGHVPPVLFAFGAAMTWRPLGLRSVLISASIAVGCGAVLKVRMPPVVLASDRLPSSLTFMVR